MSKYIKRVLDPRTAIRGIFDPVGAAHGVRTGDVAPITGKNLLGFVADPGGFLGNPNGLLAPSQPKPSGGGAPAPGSVPTGSPNYQGFQPNPFNAPGKYNQQALGLMGQVPPSGVPGFDPFAPRPGVPNQAAPGVPGNSPLLPINPGSGAYRPGADQPRLLPGPVNTGQPNMQIPNQIRPAQPFDLDELRRRISGGGRSQIPLRSLLK